MQIADIAKIVKANSDRADVVELALELARARGREERIAEEREESRQSTRDLMEVAGQAAAAMAPILGHQHVDEDRLREILRKGPSADDDDGNPSVN